MQLALVNGIAPVHLENLIDDGGHLVHIVAVECHHAHTHDVSHVVERVVFGPLQFQFTRQRRFCLDAVLQGNHRHMLFLEGLAQRLFGHLCQPLIDGLPLVVLLHEHLSV